MATDTAALKNYALQLFAHRTVSNEDMLTNPKAAKIGYIRLYDSNGDYIQLSTCRNYANNSSLVFDDTGGSEADPEYTSVTQYYHDLNLHFFVPRFNKVFDVSANSWGYAASTFTVADYELFNEGGEVIADAADTTIGFSISKGTRYLLKFKIRLFNDMVEQTLDENTRSIVTKDGLKTILRRLIHNQSPQDNGRPPMFLGVGGKGAYYISNASDGRWYYDASSSSYDAVSSDLFPTPTETGDALVFCRQGSDPDQIEGLEFTLSQAGELASGATLTWEYYDTSSDWTALHGVDDGTVNFSVNGTVRWSTPTDVKSDAELKSGTVGYYYRCRIVGSGGWTTMPQVSAATNIKPLVLRTVQTETDLQQPINVLSADVVATPHGGATAKVSAEFGLGTLTEITDAADGTLLAEAYVPIREVGIFSHGCSVTRETVDIGDVTASVSDGSMTVPNTNPRPLLLFSIMDSNGKIFDSCSRMLSYTVSGSDYIIDNLTFVPNGTYTIKYLGERITPSRTPKNILAVEGVVQEITAPVEVWTYLSDENPIDSSSGADTDLTPNLIRKHGIPIYAVGSANGPSSPNFMGAFGDTGFVQGSSVKVASQKRIRSDLHKKLARDDYAFPLINLTSAQYEYKLNIGFPLFMATMDVSESDRVEAPILVVSASGIRGEDYKHSYAVLAWSRGDPSSQEAHLRETGWKVVGRSDPVNGNLGVATTTTVSLDMKYSENGDGTFTSPYVDDDGMMYILVAPDYIVEADRTVAVTHGLREHWFLSKDGWGDIFHLAESGRRNIRKTTKKELGDLRLHHLGLITSAVGKSRGQTHTFRRGIDWTYSLGDVRADWRIDGTKGPDGANYVVTTADGTQYVPLLPSARIGMAEELYQFGTNPTTASTTLYLQHKPFSIGSVFVWEKNAETAINSSNGAIEITEIGWKSAYKWNKTDSAYSDDHLEATTGGDGAGYVKVTFDSRDWSSSSFRDVGIRYLYYDDPKVFVSYIHSDAFMLARAHLSPLSHNPPLQPAYGDRVRFYYEVEFNKKRTA